MSPKIRSPLLLLSLAVTTWLTVPARGQLNSCDLYMVNYVNASLTVTMYDTVDVPLSCGAFENPNEYPLAAPVDGKAPMVFGSCQTQDEDECAFYMGARSPNDPGTTCSFFVKCDYTVVFYQDANGTVQQCSNMGGTCYVPPNAPSARSRSMLRKGLP